MYIGNDIRLETKSSTWVIEDFRVRTRRHSITHAGEKFGNDSKSFMYIKNYKRIDIEDFVSSEDKNLKT